MTGGHSGYFFVVKEEGVEKVYGSLFVMKDLNGKDVVRWIFLGPKSEHDNFARISEGSNIKEMFIGELSIEHFVFGWVKSEGMRRYQTLKKKRVSRTEIMTDAEENEFAYLLSYFTVGVVSEAKPCESYSSRVYKVVDEVLLDGALTPTDRENVISFKKGLEGRFGGEETLFDDIVWMQMNLVGPVLGIPSQLAKLVFGRLSPMSSLERLGNVEEILQLACVVARRYAYGGTENTLFLIGCEASTSRLSPDGIKFGDCKWAASAMPVSVEAYNDIQDKFAGIIKKNSLIVVPTTLPLPAKPRILDVVRRDPEADNAYLSAMEGCFNANQVGLLGASNKRYASDSLDGDAWDALEKMGFMKMLSRRFDENPKSEFEPGNKRRRLDAPPNHVLEPEDLDTLEQLYIELVATAPAAPPPSAASASASTSAPATAPAASTSATATPAATAAATATPAAAGN